MPKVYDQQISWQAPATQKMQYDRLQDFITPALQNVTKASQNATDLMVEIGDKRAAGELEQAAKDAAFDIENWQDFSEPEKTQDKMVESAMAKYDAVMANMDPSTRRRMDMYNPKAREIYEVKAKEKAADVTYNYAYKTDTANIDNDVGRMITERAPEGPEAVKAYVDEHLAKKQKELRPADYNVYSKAVKANAQKGLIDWYVAYGNLDKAIECVKNDRYAGDINESVRANYLKALTKAKSDKSSGSGDDDLSGSNLVDTLVRVEGDTPQEAYAKMTRLTSALESRYNPDEELLKKYGNIPLAGGFTYYQLSNMDYTKAMSIIDKDLKALSKSEALDRESRQQFIPLMVEWERVSEPVSGSSSVRELKKGEDITTLKALYKNFTERGFDSQLKHAGNSDMTKTLTEIGDVINKEKTARALAFSLNGKNMSGITNNPVLSHLFPTPATPEEAKNWNKAENQQAILTRTAAMQQAEGFNKLYLSAITTWGDGNKGTTKYDTMREDLKNMLDKGQLTEAQYKARVRHLYDVSEGRASRTYPCLDATTPTRVWSQCMASFGFDTVDDSASYDEALDAGMHDVSADLRKSSYRQYEAGTVGDVYEILLSQINLAVHTQGMPEKYGIPNPGLFTDDFLAEVMNDLETGPRQGELDDIVDLTNNSSIYKEKGGDYEGKSWDPANPSPETSLDITKSKQYQLIGDIEKAISLRLGTNIKINEEQKIGLAMDIRRISSGKKHSVPTALSPSTQDELRDNRLNETTKQLIRGEK